MYRDQSKRNLTSLLTSRPKNIKTLEEAYGVKYQTPPSKVNHKSPTKQNAVPSTIAFKDRGDMECSDSMNTFRPNYNKYLITASDRYGQQLPTARRRGVSFHSNSGSATLLEERHAEVLSKQEQYFSKTEKTTSMRSVTPKPSRSTRTNCGASDEVTSLMSNNVHGNFQKKDTPLPDEDTKKKRNDYHRHHQHKNDTAAKDRLNDDKDDTEEFIALIRREIEKSVMKSMTEKMNNIFGDLNNKVDRQAAEIKKIGVVVQKLHSSLSNKIAHYGEENSRHFRYLCMKSEYDKMFYQHNNQFAAKSAPVTPPGSCKGSSMPSSAQSANNNKNNCPLTSARTLVPDQQQLNNMDAIKKPLDENMRDMVTQLKKFCRHFESTVILEEDFNKSGTSDSSSLQLTNPYNQNCNNLYPDDEANFSSDGMTPRSVDNDSALLDRNRCKHSPKEDTSNLIHKSSYGGGDV